jgi:hypothetical protein
MPYGIEVFNNNNSFQFGTTVLEGFSVISTGTVAGFGTLPLNTTNEILCIRRSNTGGIFGTTTPGTSGSWYNANSNAIDYLKLQRIRTTAENDTGAYGIRIFNTASEITYSSKFTRGQKLLHVYAPGTLGGEMIVYSGDLTGVYYGFGRMVFNTTQNNECCRFDYTANTIKSINNNYYFIPGSGTLTIAKANDSSVLIMARN